MQASSVTRLICPLVAPDPASMRHDALQAVALGATALEFRLDYLSPTPTAEQLRDLLHDLPAEIILTCRPASQGGKFSGDEPARLALLRLAAGCVPDAYVDLERGVPRQDWPLAKIILSHHDFAACPADLEALAAEMETSPAQVVKIAFAAAGPQDALKALDVLRACRKPTIALAMGEAGVLSRILARKFGALGTFASVRPGAASAPGQPTLDEFHSLYRWDALGPATAVYGVIGCPVGHSMSPAIHNAAFAQARLDAVYVPLLIAAGADPFNRFMDALLERPWLGWRGLSVTIPHKENALAYLGERNCDALACKIGAVNTITLSPDGRLRGDNTDYAAAISALCGALGIARESLSGKAAAVLGAGGAARAIVAALAHYGAAVTIYNRTLARAQELAGEFSCKAAPIDAAASTDAEILINCTPIGMHPNVNACPLESIPPTVKCVFDTIYNPVRTRLVHLAAASGCTTVTGVEMFVNQAAAQFQLWTGAAAPMDVMRQVILDRLG